MRFLTSLPLLMLACGTVSAQELTLFEQIDVDPENEQPLMMGAEQQSDQPAFTLRGTSRFGDEYTITLLNRNGEPVKIRWHEGENVPIPGFDGFSVVALSPQGVLVAHPAYDICVEADASGVTCTADNVAKLSMSANTPLAMNGTAQGFTEQQAQEFNNENAGGGFYEGSAAGISQQGVQEFINPYTGQAEVVIRQVSPDGQQAVVDQIPRRRGDRFSQFEAVRIDPADVPPNMRLIRTPFGDRIVPARE